MPLLTPIIFTAKVSNLLFAGDWKRVRFWQRESGIVNKPKWPRNWLLRVEYTEKLHLYAPCTASVVFMISSYRCPRELRTQENAALSSVNGLTRCLLSRTRLQSQWQIFKCLTVISRLRFGLNVQTVVTSFCLHNENEDFLSWRDFSILSPRPGVLQRVFSGPGFRW